MAEKPTAEEAEAPRAATPIAGGGLAVPSIEPGEGRRAVSKPADPGGQSAATPLR